MFMAMSAATMVNKGTGQIAQVGEGHVLNLDHVRYAHFRESTGKDKAGTGASSQLLVDGTPCIDIWTNGNLADNPTLTFFFPEEVHGDYQKLRRLLAAES
ncbi:MAG TPA: hypothetical protein VF584_14520 [Longimicrobium sp.]|jgi:hypothetical protein